jgi:hypothetical protein
MEQTREPSKRIRFEVFKRDSFKCQYCGRTPPAIILEVDHINPKANGGKSDINNYVTACFDCNRGKGPVPLDQVPSSLQVNIAEMKERQAQLKAYSSFLESVDQELVADADRVNNAFHQYIPDRSLSEQFRNTTLKTFQRRLPVLKIVEAMNVAGSHWEAGDITNPERLVRYFCGVCWNWIKNPETRDW